MKSIHLDKKSGVLLVGAGAKFSEILKYIVPRGFFLPVSPGTKNITVGGAISSDVHGIFLRSSWDYPEIFLGCSWDFRRFP